MRHCTVTTGGFDSETVQDVMLGAVERRFGSELPASPVEWLTDNGSCYRANETRQFARMLVDWPPESPDNQYHLNK
nr:Transposase InsD for insertion element IS2 [Escherichia coli]